MSTIQASSPRPESPIAVAVALTATGSTAARRRGPAAPAAPTSARVGRRTAYGDRGPEVKLLQEALVRVGVGVSTASTGTSARPPAPP